MTINGIVFLKKIISSIDVLIYPKQIVDNSHKEVISNFESKSLKLSKPQYFITLDIEGYILSMIWLLTVGYYLDSKFIPTCAFGNRLIDFSKENIINNSPYVFKTYFSQYNSWRDKAIKSAKDNLSNEDDVFILMLDFKSFYYSVDIEKMWFENIFNEECKKFIFENFDIDYSILKRIHLLMFTVFKAYSDKVRKINKEINNESILKLNNRTFLPIGFPLSNIISNYYLKELDNSILQKVKPIYYGRYVDDIIIVDKISHNKKIREIINEEDKSNIIDCVIGEDIVKDNIIKSEILHCGGDPVIEFQTQKVQLFCLNHEMPFTVLDSFVKQIDKNTSEFRFLPDLDDMLNRNDYSEIYHLVYQDTPNKFKFASNIALDKFSLSKFLGKYRKIGSLICDSKEKRLLEDLINLLDKKTLVENYTLWERLLQIMVVDNLFDKYQFMVNKISEALKKYQKDNNFTNYQANSLWLVLETSIYRTLALCSGNKINKIIEYINDISGLKLDFKEIYKYCKSRMVNNYILPIPIDFLLEIKVDNNINFTRFEDVFNILPSIKKIYSEHYNFYPYILRPQDIAFAKFCFDISKNNISSTKEQYDFIYKVYKEQNGFNSINISESIIIESLNQYDVIEISSNKQDKFKIAIANATLKKEDLENTLKGKPNREVERYDKLSQIIRIALKENADLLILPEGYLPLEWLPDISRISANNQIGIITGIEHIITSNTTVKKKNAFNITSIILPYKDDKYKYSYVTFHHKKHYSPSEIELINGYDLHFNESKDNYKLFHWKDLWFSVYCCFELASLKDRSLFRSIADLVVAVEWNKDVNYFNNIIESLTRDLHCFCVQVNSSNYGESRIVQPTHKEISDIVRTKGGINPTALIGEIDIKALRNFQRKKYNLQKEDDSFKPTPPDFNIEYIIAKQNDCLLDLLVKNDLDNKN